MLVTQSCLTLCDPMDYSSPGSSVHGILQATIMKWLAIPFSRGSSYPRNWTGVSHTAGRFLTIYLYKVLYCFQNITSFNAQNSPLRWERLLWPLYSISPFCNVINHVHCPTWTLFDFMRIILFLTFSSAFEPSEEVIICQSLLEPSTLWRLGLQHR